MSIETIRGRLEAATPGPWSMCSDECCVVTPRHHTIALVSIGGAQGTAHDADLMARAPNDLALLLAVAEAARALVDHFREEATIEEDERFWPTEPAEASCEDLILKAFRALEAAT